jgi:hypothetical protein
MKITKQQKALLSASDDAAYIMEPLIGKGTGPVPLASAVERILRMSLTDAGMPVSPRNGVMLRGTTVAAEARKIAERLTAQSVRGKLAA